MTESPSSNDRDTTTAGVPDGRWGALFTAICIGLIGVVAITFFTHWYEVTVFEMSGRQVIVNSLTPIVFFLGLILVLIINPIIHKLAPSLKLGRRELIYVLSMWLLTGVICYKGLGMPIMHSIGNVLNPAIEGSQMKRVGFSSYHNPDLYLPPEAARQYYFGLSDGMTRVGLFPRSPAVAAEELEDLAGLGARLQEQATPFDRELSRGLSDETRAAFAEYLPSCEGLAPMLASEFDGIVKGEVIYAKGRFRRVAIREATCQQVNRMLVEAALPGSLAAWDRSGSPLLVAGDIKDAGTLARQLMAGPTAAARRLRGRLSKLDRQGLRAEIASSSAPQGKPGAGTRDVLPQMLADALNRVIRSAIVYQRGSFAEVKIADDHRALINRLLLQDFLLDAIAPVSETGVAGVRRDDMRAPLRAAETVWRGKRRLAVYLRGRLSDSGRQALARHFDIDVKLRAALAADLNRLLRGPLMYTPDHFPEAVLREGTKRTINRGFIEAIFAEAVRANPIPVPWAFREADVKDLAACARVLKDGAAPLARHLREKVADEETLLLIDRHLAFAARNLPGTYDIKGRIEALDKKMGKLSRKGGAAATMDALKEEKAGLLRLLSEAEDAEKTESGLRLALVADLNAAVEGPVLYSSDRCAGINIDEDSTLLMNRLLLNDALPDSLAALRATIPWRQWVRPLLFWVPFMLVVILFSSSLVQVVHRQWSQHELLTYPIAEFAEGYTRQRLDRALPDIFYDKVFWVGFIIISVIYVINGLSRWNPLMIRIRMAYVHMDLLREFPFISKYCGREAYSLFRGMVYPFMVCLVVLLPTEVSLSGWMGWVLSILTIGVYFFISGENIGNTETGYIRYGMYVAMLVMMIVIGRREYANILRHAFRLRPAEDPLLRRAVTACRVFAFAFVLLIVLLAVAGLDWFVAFVLVCSFALIVILVARMTAELGIPWLVSFAGNASSLPLKLLGAAAMGPKAMAVLVAVGGMLDTHSENTIAAQETTYRKMEENPGRGMTRWGFNTVLALGIAAAITVTIITLLWNNYSYGAQREKRAFYGSSMERTAADIGRLKIESKGADLERHRGIGKLGALKGEENFYRFFLYGVVAVVFIMVMRLRFTWWPFHPLPFLLVGTWCMSRMNFSFFLGWIIKVGLLKIGGGKFFARSKPFFMGVIAGQIAVAGLFLASGAIYHVITGRQPPGFSFFY